MLGAELVDCWLKIGRAEEHAKTISDETLAWEETNPYTLTLNRDTHGERYSVNVHFSMPSPDRWSLIVGDCVHNLRSALDHLIYAIAVFQTGLNPPANERDLQFPITDCPKRFADKKWQIDTLSDAVRTSIEGVQPYNRPHHTLPPLLRLVRDFDNRDKHKLLNIASAWQQSGDANIDCPLGHVPQNIIASASSLTDGAEIVSFTVDPPSLEVSHHYKAGFTVALSHASGHRGVVATGIRRLLSLLCEEVRTIVEVVGQKA